MPREGERKGAPRGLRYRDAQPISLLRLETDLRRAVEQGEFGLLSAGGFGEWQSIGFEVYAGSTQGRGLVAPGNSSLAEGDGTHLPDRPLRAAELPTSGTVCAPFPRPSS